MIFRLGFLAFAALVAVTFAYLDDESYEKKTPPMCVMDDDSKPGPCNVKYRQHKDHTMCLGKSENARTVKMTDQWKKRILDYHNLRRAEVRPAATNMMKMRWSDELEEMARRWANACEFRGGLHHDKKRFIPGGMSIGQNLAGYSINFDLALKWWWFEKDEYTYGKDFVEQMQKGRCGYMIGHYTQMVWAESYLLGCAAANCGNDTNNIIVCNYGPSGNLLPFDKPYETGEQCSKCKNCVNGLCDCGDLDCNGGYLDPSTCTCNCTFRGDGKVPGFITGPNCELDCNAGGDMEYCGDFYKGHYDCNEHFTVKKCPHMCKACPFAGKDYQNTPLAIPKTDL